MKTITAKSAMFSPDWGIIYIGEYFRKEVG